VASHTKGDEMNRTKEVPINDSIPQILKDDLDQENLQAYFTNISLLANQEQELELLEYMENL
jgi:hypothetical protein